MVSRTPHHARAQPTAASCSTARALSRCSRSSTGQRAHSARAVGRVPGGNALAFSRVLGAYPPASQNQGGRPLDDLRAPRARAVRTPAGAPPEHPIPPTESSPARCSARAPAAPESGHRPAPTGTRPAPLSRTADRRTPGQGRSSASAANAGRAAATQGDLAQNGPAQQPMPASREVHQGRMVGVRVEGVFAPVHTAQTPQLLSGTASGVRSRGMGHPGLSW